MKIIESINENKWVKFVGTITGFLGLYQLINPSLLKRVLDKALTTSQIKMTVDIYVITDFTAIIFSIFLVWLLMTIIKQLYEHKILQQLLIINTQTHSWIQPTSGWSTETELKSRLTDGQLEYAMKKNWITDNFLIFI